jgi:integrase
VLTLARTGLRLGEAAALKWGDVDFHGGFIHVVRSVTPDGRISTPKSGRGRRVDMSAGLAEILKAELVKARAVALELGVEPPSGSSPMFEAGGWTEATSEIACGPCF